MNSTTLVGYITPKFIKYQSGSGNTSVYKFYWFGYEQESTTLLVNQIRSIISVSNSRSVIGGNNGTYTTPRFFAEIASVANGGIDAAGNIRFYEAEKPSRYVFPTNKSYVKDVDNINTVYQKLYTGVAMSGGSAVITTAAPNKFVGPAGTSLSAYFSQQYYTIVVKQQLDALTIPGYYCSLVFAVVTTVISRPLILSTLSKLTSGNIICSFTPKL
jgi:hypothetical protein